MTYCGSVKTGIPKNVKIYCEECGKEITDSHYFIRLYDLALDADDGYGDYEEVITCKECFEE